MRTTVICLVLAVAGCGTTKTLNTIEDAEKFTTSKGIVLTDKQEIPFEEVHIGKRIANYKVEGVDEAEVRLIQFKTPEAATNWVAYVNALPFSTGEPGDLFCRDSIGFYVSGTNYQQVYDQLYEERSSRKEN